jgi:hypothetical protein
MSKEAALSRIGNLENLQVEEVDDITPRRHYYKHEKP